MSGRDHLKIVELGLIRDLEKAHVRAAEIERELEAVRVTRKLVDKITADHPAETPQTEDGKQPAFRRVEGGPTDVTIRFAKTYQSRKLWAVPELIDYAMSNGVNTTTDVKNRQKLMSVFYPTLNRLVKSNILETRKSKGKPRYRLRSESGNGIDQSTSSHNLKPVENQQKLEGMSG